MSRFTEQEQKNILGMLDRARRKGFLRDLILHGYNNEEYSVNLCRVLCYLNGEPQGSHISKGVQTMFDLMSRGIESHEVVGDDVIEELKALRRAEEARAAQ